MLRGRIRPYSTRRDAVVEVPADQIGWLSSPRHSLMLWFIVPNLGGTTGDKNACTVGTFWYRIRAASGRSTDGVPLAKSCTTGRIKCSKFLNLSLTNEKKLQCQLRILDHDTSKQFPTCATDLKNLSWHFVGLEVNDLVQCKRPTPLFVKTLSMHWPRVLQVDSLLHLYWFIQRCTRSFVSALQFESATSENGVPFLLASFRGGPSIGPLTALACVQEGAEINNVTKTRNTMDGIFSYFRCHCLCQCCTLEMRSVDQITPDLEFSDWTKMGRRPEKIKEKSAW